MDGRYILALVSFPHSISLVSSFPLLGLPLGGANDLFVSLLSMGETFHTNCKNEFNLVQLTITLFCFLSLKTCVQKADVT